MTADERKKYLQSIGALPPDEDGLMPFSVDAAQDRRLSGAAFTDAERASMSNNGDQTSRELSGIPLTSDEAAASSESNPNDTRAKLRKLMTPELMQRLREKAGMGGTAP